MPTLPHVNSFPQVSCILSKPIWTLFVSSQQLKTGLTSVAPPCGLPVVVHAAVAPVHTCLKPQAENLVTSGAASPALTQKSFRRGGRCGEVPACIGFVGRYGPSAFPEGTWHLCVEGTFRTPRRSSRFERNKERGCNHSLRSQARVTRLSDRFARTNTSLRRTSGNKKTTDRFN